MLPAIERRKPPPIALLREQSLRIAIAPNAAFMMGWFDFAVPVQDFPVFADGHHRTVKRRFGLRI